MPQHQDGRVVPVFRSAQPFKHNRITPETTQSAKMLALHIPAIQASRCQRGGVSSISDTLLRWPSRETPNTPNSYRQE